jgi:hypothetical protein
MTKETTALATQAPGYLALAQKNLGEMMAEELEGLDIRFDKVKIPSGGILAFEIPGGDGETETVKEFSAVILFHHSLNAYFKTPFNGGSNPPDCGSYDGINGVGDPGGKCKSCSLNSFGTGKNGGKACQNRHRLFVLREGNPFPMIYSLPASSVDEFGKYVKVLIGRGRRANSVVTRFSLKKDTNKGGVVYSKAQFSIDRPLAPEEYAPIKKLSAQVRASSAKLPCNVDATVTGEVAVDTETGEVIGPVGADV